MLWPEVLAMSLVAFHLLYYLQSTSWSATDPENDFLLQQRTIYFSFLSTDLKWFHLQHISQVCFLSCWDFLKNCSTVPKVTKIPDLVWDCLAVLQALHPSGELGTPGCITAKGWQLKTIWVLKLLEMFFKVRSSKSSIPHLGSASQFFKSYLSSSLLLFPMAELRL